MQRFSIFFTQAWDLNLASAQQELVRTSIELFAREERMKSAFTEYSFVVFPMSKAYEGFLKKYFYDAGLISETMYMDRRFRIGRALNPDLRASQRDEEWIYPKIQKDCGNDVARGIWDTWLLCRNQLFHYFPDQHTWLSLSEAGKRIEMLAQSMELLSLCAVQYRSS